MEIWQDEKHERTRTWFRAKWVAIGESPWLFLPERVVTWFLSGQKRPWQWNSTWGYGVRRLRYMISTCIVYGYLLVLLSTAVLGQGHVGMASRIAVISGVLLHILNRLATRGVISERATRLAVSILAPAATIPAVWVWLSYILAMPLTVAVLVLMITVAPFQLSALVSTVSRLFLINETHRTFPLGLSFFLAWATAASSAVTLAAMFVGHLADDKAWVPQTGSMVASNVLFDTLTLVLTIILLKWAVSRQPILRIPIAVLADLVIAVSFAFGSLYFGLAFTKKALAIQEIARICIGRSLDGSKWEVGPYFWTMHTTFIPTLVYLSAVMLCWTGKVMLIPVRAILGRGQEHSNPLRLTAALSYFVAALFTLAAHPFGTAQERCKRQEELLSGGRTAISAPMSHCGFRPLEAPITSGHDAHSPKTQD
jgi:hypothetical protein